MNYNFIHKYNHMAHALQERKKLLALGTEKLCFGCGYNPISGWTNIDGGDGVCWLRPTSKDIIQLDIADCLAMIDDNTVSYITSEQFLEHFTRQDGIEICKQWFRILKPSGVLRFHVPDLYNACKLYLNEVPYADWATVQKPRRMLHVKEGVGINSFDTEKDPNRVLLDGEDLLPCHVLNQAFYCEGHKYIYDFEYFAQLLPLLGFKNVVKTSFGISEHSALKNIDKHDGGSTGKGWIAEIGLFVEATK